ncbi:5908_t:CDS:2 [Ambispora gerdemannii]|uniref:5908_t:CDS:1 n=1 Tax=Ambispora gerdemannii TaxID=144530 RepID=A0A9N8ZD49_9GLOM|nr:5908_t:CDS:2 [Ambispora gerdemannii]
MESQSKEISINDAVIQNSSFPSISEQTPTILKSLKRDREQGPIQKRSKLENQETQTSVTEVQQHQDSSQGIQVDTVSTSKSVEYVQPLKQQVLSGEEELDMLKRKALFRVEVVIEGNSIIEKIQMPNENVNKPKVEESQNPLTKLSVDDDLMDLLEGEISDLDSDLLLSSEDESAQPKNITSNEIVYKKVEPKNSLDKSVQMVHSASTKSKRVVSKGTSDEDIFEDSSDLDSFSEANSDTEYEDDEYKGPSVRALSASSPRRSERQRRPPEILALSQSAIRQKARSRKILQRLNNINENEFAQPAGSSKDHYQPQNDEGSVKKEKRWNINDSDDELSSENSENSPSDYSSEGEKKENVRDTKSIPTNSIARTMICPSLPIPKSECKICGGLRPMSRLLSCHDCNLCVHSDCYGQVGYKDTPSIWRCDPCLNRKNPKVAKICKCVLCALPEGENNAMKRTAGYNWCHVICAAFFPQVSFRDAESVSMIEDVMNVDEISWKMICFICKKTGGATLNCAHDGCQTAFHVTCVQKQSTCQICFEIIPKKKIESDVDPIDFGNGMDGDLSPKIFCQNHKTSLATFVKLSDRGINDNFSAIYTFIRIHKQFQFQGAEERRRYRFRDLIFANDMPSPIQASTRSPSPSLFSTLSFSLTSPSMTCLSPASPPNVGSSGFSRPPPTVCAKCGTNASPMWWPRDKEQQENFLSCKDLGVKKVHGTKFPQIFSPLTFGRILGESMCHKCYWKEKKANNS